MMDALSEVGATREVGPGPSYSNDVRKATNLMLIVTGSKINSHNTDSPSSNAKHSKSAIL